MENDSLEITSQIYQAIIIIWKNECINLPSREKQKTNMEKRHTA